MGGEASRRRKWDSPPVKSADLAEEVANKSGKDGEDEVEKRRRRRRRRRRRKGEGGGG